MSWLQRDLVNLQTGRLRIFAQVGYQAGTIESELIQHAVRNLLRVLYWRAEAPLTWSDFGIPLQGAASELQPCYHR